MQTLDKTENRQDRKSVRSLREQLVALVAFEPIFARVDFSVGRETSSVSRCLLYGPPYSEVVSRFVSMAYASGWVRNVFWSDWRNTEHGNRMMYDATAMASADADDIAHVLTTCIRAERFCDGYLGAAFESGLIMRVLARAKTLLQMMVDDVGDR